MRRPPEPDEIEFQRLADSHPEICDAIWRGDGVTVVNLCEATGIDPLRLLRDLARAGGWEFAAWDGTVSTTRQVMALTRRFATYRGCGYDKTGYWYRPLHLGTEVAIARVGRLLLDAAPLAPDGLSQETVDRAVDHAAWVVYSAISGHGGNFYRALNEGNQGLAHSVDAKTVLDIVLDIPRMSPAQTARVRALADWPLRNARRRRQEAARRARGLHLAAQ